LVPMKDITVNDVKPLVECSKSEYGDGTWGAGFTG
jgi:hypothetical protein